MDMNEHFKKHINQQLYFHFIVTEWESYYPTIITDLHRFAYSLDPEFMDHDHLGDDEIVSCILRCLNKIYVYHPRKEFIIPQFMEQYSFFKSKKGDIFSAPIVQDEKNKISGSEWWTRYGSPTNLLRTVSINVLQRLLSSSSSERIGQSTNG